MITHSSSLNPTQIPLMIILEGYIQVPTHELSLFKNALQQHIAATQQEPGCVCFRVNQDSERKEIFWVYEEFIDQRAFDFHQQRSKASEWAKASQNCERFYELREA